METILIVGVDGVVGANIAATLSEQHRVIGLTLQRKTAIVGCETRHCPDDLGAIRNWVAALRPRSIIFCGASADSCWDVPDVRLARPQAVEAARRWAGAANDYGCRLTVVSTDGIFTGPWMFHSEQSTSHCLNGPAETARQIEAAVAEACPYAMIVRTNAFGWTPQSSAPGWIERLLTAVESGAPLNLDCIRHATPIVASALARILDLACDRRLEGKYHIAGGERVNPVQFAQRLANVFELPAPQPVSSVTLTECHTEFGCGETSLDTKRIRKTLGVAMPFLGESLAELRQQVEDGYRERLNPSPLPVHEKVA